MEIRKDFQELSCLLSRLIVFSEEFDSFDRVDWSHLKSKEDYNRIYSYKNNFHVIEKIYQEGRGFAIGMKSMLVGWNSVSDFPNFAAYVDSLDVYVNESLDGPNSLRKVLHKVKMVLKQNQIDLFSTNQMMIIFEKQLNLAESVAGWIKHAKKTPYYKAGTGLPQTQRPWWLSLPAIILFLITLLTFVFTFIIKIAPVWDFTVIK
jgi:hypothetical protein